MKSMFLPLFAVFGVSLFSYDSSVYFSFLPTTIAISDMVIILLLFYALINVRLVSRNSISTATILLAAVLLISGIYNIFSVPTFLMESFFYNYLRMIGIVAMVMLLPPLLSRIGEERLARASMWVLRLHCAILLFDAFHLIPLEWLPADVPGVTRSTRAAGLFYEPGWFGTWVGLTVFYVLQVQRNSTRQYFYIFDIIFVTLAIMASTGIRGIVFLGFAMVILLFGMGIRTQLKLIGSILLLVMFLSFGGKTMAPILHIAEEQGGEQNVVDYVQERLTRFSPTNLTDGSAIDRIKSTSVGIVFTLNNSPLLGLGMGTKNQTQRLPKYNKFNEAAGSSAMLTSIFLAGGLLGIILYSLILIKMLVVPKTRILGVGLSLAALIWGGAFESFIWWFIALAVALVSAPQHRKKHSSLVNNFVKENP